MSSPLRTAIMHAWIALAAGAVTAAPLGAQQSSAQTSVAISIRVQPTLAIRGVAAGVSRVESARHVVTAIVVDVESNMPYRVSVRLGRAPGAGRVLVRNAAGAFEALLPGASVTTVVSRAPGRRAHEVLCRVETTESDALGAAPCALAYELSAEYGETLVRTTATAN